MLNHLGYGILERLPGKDIGNYYFGGMDIFTHFKRCWLGNLYVISELKIPTQRRMADLFHHLP